jgi:uracil-DNA glycosylase
LSRDNRDAAATALAARISACAVCAKHLPHGVRPVVGFSPTARLVIIGQAPGSKVHESGIPWDDRSGDRLRKWTGLSRDEMYDPTRVALVPMGFCYPGKASGGDKPPRRECAPLWHEEIMDILPSERLTLLVGTYAQAAYLPETKGWTLQRRMEQAMDFLPRYLPLPHPAWRSTLFMRANPWFESKILPRLRTLVNQAIR